MNSKEATSVVLLVGWMVVLGKLPMPTWDSWTGFSYSVIVVAFSLAFIMITIRWNGALKNGNGRRDNSTEE